jgi:hypothetical protein
MKNSSWPSGGPRARLADAFAEIAVPIPWSGPPTPTALIRIFAITILLAPVAVALAVADVIRCAVDRLALFLMTKVWTW